MGDDLMVVSPDVGGVVRARALAKRLERRRPGHRRQAPLGPGESEVMNIIGDVKAAAASCSTTSSIRPAPCATPPRP
jgi:phosphoribosylpyrophosphate synthetase